MNTTQKVNQVLLKRGSVMRELMVETDPNIITLLHKQLDTYNEMLRVLKG